MFTPIGASAQAAATRDGLVLQRYTRGINDSALIANVQPGSQIATDTINKINSRPSLDVTCKGGFDGTDATIIARHLAGFRDNSLTNGLTLAGQRNTTQLVQRYLDDACVSGLTCASSGTPPGGLYVGYYNEDPTNNPEDPTIGSVYLRLPQGNSTFSGDMYFTYFGCQNKNVGIITGTKNQLNLSANWSGTIDNSTQSGTMTGQFQPALGIYQGTYTNSGGKQFRDLSPCITYYIAAFGAWELFPVGQTFSSGASQAASVSGNVVSWQAPAGTIACFVSAIDQLATQGGGGNAIIWQSAVAGTTASVAIPTTVLQSGRSYVATVTCTASASLQRNYFSSTAFDYN